MNTATTTRGTSRVWPSAPSIRRLKFGRDNTFHAVVRERVEAHLRSIGRRERDCPEMYAKTAIIFATFVAAYVLLVFAATAWWQVVPLAVLLALPIVAIGFNVMHDGSHDAYSDSPFVNRLMSTSLDLVGGSSHFWHWKHVVFHHTFVNVVGYDTDINLAGLGRLTPHHPRAWVHRWQHWYVWLLYGLMAMKWHLYDDFRLVLNGRMGEHVAPGPRRRQLAVFVAGKVVFFTLAFGLPLLFHPLWVVAAVYVLTGFGARTGVGNRVSAGALRRARRFSARALAGAHGKRVGGAPSRDDRRLCARQRRGGLVARWIEFSDRASSLLADVPRELPGDRADRRTDLRGIRRTLQPQPDRARGGAIPLSLAAPLGRAGSRRLAEKLAKLAEG